MTRAIILAAGSGSRLMPVTSDRPKAMVEFQGQTLAATQLGVMRAWGIDDINFVVGYHAEAVASLGLPLIWNDRFETTNMVSSLMCARELLDGRDDIVIAYADIVYEPRVLKAVLETEGDLVVAADRNWLDLWQVRMDDPKADAETFRVREDGTLLELGRKPRNLDEIQGQYIGLIRLPAGRQKALLDAYDALDPQALYEGRPVSTMYMTTLIQHLVDTGWTVRPAWISSGWLEIDTIQDFERYNALARNGTLGRLYKACVPLDIEPLRVIAEAVGSRPPAGIANDDDRVIPLLASLSDRAWFDLAQLATLDGLARKLEISGRLDASQEAVDGLLAAFLLAYAQTRDLRHVNTVLKALDGTLKSPCPRRETDQQLRQWCRSALA